MLEKVIEDLIANFPSDFFDEELRLLHRQLGIKGRILDLVFEDSNKPLLLIEVKANPLKRRDVGQAGEYFGLMRVEFPDREIRMAVFATGVEPEQRIYLEAIGVEVYVVDQPRLEEIAAANGVDTVAGIQRPKAVRQATRAAPVDIDRREVTNETEYFELIKVLDVSVQDRLAAIYGAIKKNPHTTLRFLERGRVVVSVEVPGGSSVDVLFVGVDFKGAKHNPARGTLTLLWKRMLTGVDQTALMPFARVLDELLGREKATIVTDPAEKSGTYDTLVVETDLEDETKFVVFLKALDDHFDRLSFSLSS